MLCSSLLRDINEDCPLCSNVCLFSGESGERRSGVRPGVSLVPLTRVVIMPGCSSGVDMFRSCQFACHVGPSNAVVPDIVFFPL